MSHFFGSGLFKRVPSRRDERRIDAIAQRHDAAFRVLRDDPGSPLGFRTWFQCENRGAPFDSQTARAVLAAVRAEGIAVDEIDAYADELYGGRLGDG